MPSDLPALALAKAKESDFDAAGVYATLAVAQAQKGANLIAYLNSDRSTWAVEDENLVRAYLGLDALPDPEPGG